ncbi:hypothetical protein [Halomicrobium salinisoli]|uniref:hypothetical protein n=1 Tax=Halomicrobium salinisoli TaxID=2878391 RepID=UPI001CF0B855|nr:hypothetical protein [Halomicrobium salinisoli]
MFGEAEPKRQFVIAAVAASVVIYALPEMLVRDFPFLVHGAIAAVGVVGGIFYRVGLIGTLTGVCILFTVLMLSVYYNRSVDQALGFHTFIPVFVVVAETLLFGVPAFFLGVGARRYLLAD